MDSREPRLSRIRHIVLIFKLARTLRACPKSGTSIGTFPELCFIGTAMRHESLVGRHYLPRLQDNRR
jgi:hypothetical protein